MTPASLIPAANTVRFSCAACGATRDSARPVIRAGGACPFDLVRCGDCGMVQQHPRYLPVELSRLYASDYYVFEEDESARWARAVQQYVVHLASLEARGERRLLDVGCALGHFAALARGRGWQVTGLDVSADAASRAALNFGLEVRAGPLSRHVDTLHRFDVVFLGDVIEHVPHPAQFLRDVRRVLTPGGVVCIDTPNWGGFWRRWTGRRWIGLNRYHINLFDAESLTHLLSTSGFESITTGSYTHYRYDGWAARPELSAWLNRLPTALAWRVGRWLVKLGRRSMFKTLIDFRSGDDAAASRMVDALVSAMPSRSFVGGHSADNLIAFAARK